MWPKCKQPICSHELATLWISKVKSERLFFLYIVLSSSRWNSIPPLSFILWFFLVFIELHLFGIRVCNRLYVLLYLLSYHELGYINKKEIKAQQSIKIVWNFFCQLPSFVSVKISASNFGWILKQTVRNRNKAIYHPEYFTLVGTS